MKKIPLNKTQFVLVDDEYYNLLKDYHWSACTSRNRSYARTFITSEYENQKRKSCFLQNLIIGKAPTGQRLSFKDNNSLNCQKSNLEFISRSQAAHNYYKKVHPNKNNIENFRGVSVLFVARIRFKNKIYRLGNFSNEVEAAIAYNNKAKEFYGDKAIINEVF